MGDQLGGAYRGPDQAETPDRGRLQDRSAQRHAEQPDIAERVLVPDPAAEQVMANAGGQQPGSEVMRLRGRGGVLERAGVGSQGGVSGAAISGVKAVPSRRPSSSTRTAVAAAARSIRC